MRLLYTPPRSRKQQIAKMVSLQVPAVKLYYKLLSVLPQDRLLNPDVVKLYLVLFSSLISKPDRFSAHRDPIFYCEQDKEVCRRNGADFCTNPRAGVPSLWWKWFQNSPHAEVGVVSQI